MEDVNVQGSSTLERIITFLNLDDVQLDYVRLGAFVIAVFCAILTLRAAKKARDASFVRRGFHR